VALKAAVRSVSADPHSGQATPARDVLSVSGTGPAVRSGAACGGAMPAAASLRWPAAVIQSVDQAGLSTVRTSTSVKPAAASRDETSLRISCMAGQPE